ncbi:hypothetical protein QBC35DRAFT_541440 [Podospora australis]|uniref:Uncharacterized protein n=1 Tax=Podospora australis TaxID=1536484 RepID=A0AAN7AJ42_9PEZI|nr:hypothetical protein QBC35DRAFT_541440 [Podospora australis]
MNCYKKSHVAEERKRGIMSSVTSLFRRNRSAENSFSVRKVERVGSVTVSRSAQHQQNEHPPRPLRPHRPAFPQGIDPLRCHPFVVDGNIVSIHREKLASIGFADIRDTQYPSRPHVQHSEKREKKTDTTNNTNNEKVEVAEVNGRVTPFLQQYDDSDKTVEAKTTLTIGFQPSKDHRFSARFVPAAKEVEIPLAPVKPFHGWAETRAYSTTSFQIDDSSNSGYQAYCPLVSIDSSSATFIVNDIMTLPSQLRQLEERPSMNLVRSIRAQNVDSNDWI